MCQEPSLESQGAIPATDASVVNQLLAFPGMLTTEQLVARLLESPNASPLYLTPCQREHVAAIADVMQARAFYEERLASRSQQYSDTLRCKAEHTRKLANALSTMVSLLDGKATPE